MTLTVKPQPNPSLTPTAVPNPTTHQALALAQRALAAPYTTLHVTIPEDSAEAEHCAAPLMLEHSLANTEQVRRKAHALSP